MPDKQIRFRFEAGMGDAVHMAFLLQLYKARGYDIHVSVNQNRDFIFDCAEVRHVPMNPSEAFHKWRYRESWGNMDLPVWVTNKPMQGLDDELMPPLGDPEMTWKELCHVRIVSDGCISQEASCAVDEFVKDLPRPIMALHTCGDSFSTKKNLDHSTTKQFMEMWLDRTGGSIVQLNAVKSEPSFPHERVKTHKNWRRIGLDWLCALYYMSDLMIGVDSGPFHLASFTDVPCLGVFRQIQPVHCCIPNPNAWYLVSDIHHDAWEANKDDWSFVEYHGPEPDAEDIFEAAQKRLAFNHGKTPR
jgi:hypothetical protein